MTLMRAGAGKQVRYYEYAIVDEEWGYSTTSGTLFDMMGKALAKDIYIVDHMNFNFIDLESNCGMYLLSDDSKNYYGVIDDEGEVRIPPIYDELKRLGKGCFFAVKGDEWGAVDMEGNWIVRLIGEVVQP